MTNRLNLIINLFNLFLIFSYFILINLNQVKKEFEFLLITLIVINLILKLYNWHNLKNSKKDYLNSLKSNYFLNDKLTKLSIFILSIVLPIYMIFQKDSLVIDLFIEKLSFFLVFVFSIIGFYLEFFILESKSNK